MENGSFSPSVIVLHFLRLLSSVPYFLLVNLLHLFHPFLLVHVFWTSACSHCKTSALNSAVKNPSVLYPQTPQLCQVTYILTPYRDVQACHVIQSELLAAMTAITCHVFLISAVNNTLSVNRYHHV